MAWQDSANKVAKSMIRETIRNTDRTLNEAERRAKSEGRELNDKYYEMRERNEAMKDRYNQMNRR